MSSVGSLNSWWTWIPPSCRARLHIVAVKVTLSPFEFAEIIQYIMYLVSPAPRNPRMPKFLVYEYWSSKPWHEYVAFIHVLMYSFLSSNFSYYWMELFVNEIMASHFNQLDKDEASSSSLDGMLHRLTPTTIYSIVSSTTLVLIILLYSNISSSCDFISDNIWTGFISNMGNFSSMMTPRKVSYAVMILV